MRHFFLSLALIFLGANIALAQVSSNAFSVRAFIVDDFVSPSTPTLLLADPIASTQINLSWSESTDNYAVSGYSVFRDGVPIATTTLLSYSDTGLTASTTYSYFVYAFDIAFNYSSSSNSLSTTTPETPSLPPSPPPSDPEEVDSGHQEGTATRVVLKDFWIEEGFSTSSLRLQTSLQSRIEVRWGRTTSYELGYVVSSIYKKEHEVLLTDLEPGTVYEYEIIGYTPLGHQSVIRSGSFTTLNKTLPVNPVNVSRFTAVQNGDNVDLSWKIPTDDHVSYVRVVRSHLGFPEYPQDGAIVYQGNNESVRDLGVLSQYSPVYYTAFVYGVDGSVSSGAVAIVYASKSATEGYQGEIDVGTVIPATRVPVVTDEATSSIDIERVTVEMKMPKPSDILITQKGISYSLFDSNLVLDSTQDYVVSIPRTAISGNLKSIIVTVLDPTDNKSSYSYLLRINQDQTMYSAAVPTLGVVGRSQVRVEIYDYESLIIATYQTPVTFSVLEDSIDEVVFPDSIYNSVDVLLAIPTLVVVIGVGLYFLYRRRGEDNN